MKIKKCKRCRCHKHIVYIDTGESGDECIRKCFDTSKVLSSSEMYLATWDSDEEIYQKSEDKVQKGCVIIDE